MSINRCFIVIGFVSILVHSPRNISLASDTTKVAPKDTLSETAPRYLYNYMLDRSVKARSDSWFTGFLQLKFGHYDNLTKAETTGTPKVRELSPYVTPYMEFGIRHKFLRGSIFGYLYVPLGGTTRYKGYEHSAWQYGWGLITRIQVLPWWSKINLMPVGGLERIYEDASIKPPPNDTGPTLLDLKYRDWVKSYGAELIYRLKKEKTNDVKSLLFSYVFENSKVRAHKFKIEYRAIGFSVTLPKTLKEESYFVYVDHWTVAFEYISRNDGRETWFLLFGFGIEENFKR